jgi:hypothetical protein
MNAEANAISRINKNNNIHIIFIRPPVTGIKTRVLIRQVTSPALKPGF